VIGREGWLSVLQIDSSQRLASCLMCH